MNSDLSTKNWKSRIMNGDPPTQALEKEARSGPILLEVLDILVQLASRVALGLLPFQRSSLCRISSLLGTRLPGFPTPDLLLPFRIVLAPFSFVAL